MLRSITHACTFHDVTTHNPNPNPRCYVASTMPARSTTSLHPTPTPPPLGNLRGRRTGKRPFRSVCSGRSYLRDTPTPRGNLLTGAKKPHVSRANTLGRASLRRLEPTTNNKQQPINKQQTTTNNNNNSDNNNNNNNQQQPTTTTTTATATATTTTTITTTTTTTTQRPRLRQVPELQDDGCSHVIVGHQACFVPLLFECCSEKKRQKIYLSSTLVHIFKSLRFI